MSNIDKQAVTAKTKELASLMVERFSMNPVSCKLLNEAWKKEFPDEVAIAERMLALLDENIQLQREKDAIEAVALALALRDDMRQARERLEATVKRIAEQREYYEGVIADGSKRIAELERSETQLINERDAAESALADMYQAATGERPEWSNMFGFADAVDVVEERLATLEANQSQTTPTGIQLITEAIGAHGYIVGCLLQGRPDLALEESRKWVSAFGQAAEIVSAQGADDIKVKGD
ncbi:ead/Ea22-like family protein [Salmonella enterica subsp. enterica]|nr:ead/Ea22-like family protein [Salmonella enterica subsp. enterica serovar Poona]EBX0404812.1 ead/Ea22-like family protein [Salmonella enterica subsp. enterica serovar Poona]ECD4301459.1 ead/Ea22-like family protein [Salmonella enterica subsp. enterica serovar Poona]EIG1171985.1 ead/Ea22-like family protein [Salmonella enterica]